MTLLKLCQDFSQPVPGAHQLLFRLDRGQKLVEMRYGIVRSGGRLRMVLDAENRERAVTDAFNGAVVEVHMCDLQITRAGDAALVALHCESMILRSNQNAP